MNQPDCDSKCISLPQIDRMKRAVSNLYSDPHNRFKIFKNGRCLLPQNSRPQVERELAEWMGTTEGGEGEGEDGVVNRLSSLACTALLAPMGREGASKTFEVSREILETGPMGSRGGGYRSCDSAKTQLPSGCILDKLLGLQVLHILKTKGKETSRIENGPLLSF